MATCLLAASATATTKPSINNLLKRGKKTSTVDNDYTILDEALLHNDIRSHYNIQKLDTANYMKVLNESYKYARGMFEGVHIEVEEWLANEDIYKEAVAESFASLKKYKSLEDRHVDIATTTALGSINYFDNKAKLIRTRWYLYKNALKNLIKYGKPHPQFYELISNIFTEIDMGNIGGSIYIESLRLDSRERHLNFYSTRRKAHVNESETDLIQMVKEAEIFYKEILRINNLDINSKKCSTLDSLLKAILYIKSTLFSNIIGDASINSLQEGIAQTRLYYMLRPLFIANKPFIDALSSSRKQLPKMTKLRTESIEALAVRTMGSIFKQDKAVFLVEKLIYYQPKTTLLSKPQMISQILENKYYKTVSDSVKVALPILQGILKENAGPLFTPNSPEFFPPITESVSLEVVVTSVEESAIIEEEAIEAVDEEIGAFNWDAAPDYSPPLSQKQASYYPSPNRIPLRPLLLKIFKNIMNGHRHSGICNTKWSDVLVLIQAIGGVAKANGGSIHVLSVPMEGTFPIRFDEPHPTSRLGYSVFTLRKIFQKWGLSEDMFIEQ